MKSTRLLAVVVGILITVALCTGVTPPAPASEPSQIEELKKEVASLRQRVESLEKRLEDRCRLIPRDGREDPMIIKPPFRRGPDRRNWRPFEFNGMTFYIVPVNTPQSPAPEPGK